MEDGHYDLVLLLYAFTKLRVPTIPISTINFRNTLNLQFFKLGRYKPSRYFRRRRNRQVLSNLNRKTENAVANLANIDNFTNIASLASLRSIIAFRLRLWYRKCVYSPWLTALLHVASYPQSCVHHRGKMHEHPRHPRLHRVPTMDMASNGRLSRRGHLERITVTDA